MIQASRRASAPLASGPKRKADAKPVRGAVADDDHQRENAEQQQCAQGEGIVAVGAGRRPAHAQLCEQRGQALTVRAPQRGCAGIFRAQSQRVLIGRRRAVPDAGNALDAADGLFPGGPAHAAGAQ